ncbi:uncharacterized protein LOC117587712 [Drosophila guanche]|uniref:Uncharacterized protein n=1 Tax=Drosophila guanche TaxID=7266 RepID=A0A3B0JRS1_DROGU|nr:uncharacterized protein LOC117587712 [Drosophila guanche]SPP75371.1 Hypothetical predicted protein [Drosophila guanche]
MPRRYSKRRKLDKLNNSNHDASVNWSTNEVKLREPEDDGEDAPKEVEQGQESEDESKDDNKRTSNCLRYVMETTPHFSHTSLNKGFAVKPDEELQMFPSCREYAPVPLYVASDGQTPLIEPCVKRPQAYDDYMHRLQLLKAQYDNRTEKMKQKEKKKKEKIYDARLFDIAEHIASQENRYFMDSYDYYYTGGNLQTMSYKGKTLAMHVSGDRLRNLHFSEVQDETIFWDPLYSTMLEETSSEAFQLLPMESFRVNHGHMFLSRFLKEISIYELKESDSIEEYELVCQCKFSNQQLPFISAAQAAGNANILALACQDRTVSFLDLVTQQDIEKHNVCMLKSFNKHSSTWAQLIPSGSSSFHYLCQPMLLTVDVRIDQPLNPCHASSVDLIQCETFSCLARSVNPNLLYVASNHKLHCLDMRCLGKRLSDRAVLTWTHQMTYPPTFMDTCMHEGSEYVAMSSLLASDQRICELKGALAESVNDMSSPTIPYKPLSMEETLVDARLQGFVDVYADLKERVKACVTGLRFSMLEKETVDHGFAQLLTSNSIGDVFSQRLTVREKSQPEEHRTGLHNIPPITYYGNLVNKCVKRQELRCTEVHSVPVLRDILKMEARRASIEEKPEEITIEYGLEESQEEIHASQETNTSKENADPAEAASPEPPKPDFKKKAREVGRGPWQKSAYKLSSYTDMLSTRLLSVWDMDDYDHTRDMYASMINEHLKEENKEPNDRMDDWLKQLKTEAPKTEDDDSPLVPGTNLPKRYGVTSANCTLVESFEVEEAPGQVLLSTHQEMSADLPFNPKKEPSVDDDVGGPSSSQRLHSTLLPCQSTIIEYDYEEAARNIVKAEIRTPAKKPKTNYTKGF